AAGFTAGRAAVIFEEGFLLTAAFFAGAFIDIALDFLCFLVAMSGRHALTFRPRQARPVFRLGSASGSVPRDLRGRSGGSATMKARGPRSTHADLARWPPAIVALLVTASARADVPLDSAPETQTPPAASASSPDERDAAEADAALKAKPRTHL